MWCPLYAFVEKVSNWQISEKETRVFWGRKIAICKFINMDLDDQVLFWLSL